MTRKQIEECYANENGIIIEHGKFEGEAIYVPYFWELYLNGMDDSWEACISGMDDEDDGTIKRFNVSPEDRQEFPELKQRRTIRLIQRDDGFVCEV
jgi:hypothetical protein